MAWWAWSKEDMERSISQRVLQLFLKPVPVAIPGRGPILRAPSPGQRAAVQFSPCFAQE